MNEHAFPLDLGLVLAHARLYERLAESAVERRRASAGPGIADRVARVIVRVRRAMTQPATTANDTLPTLIDYPYAR